jgi:hypothetical protein
MITSYLKRSATALDPEQLAMLQGVFDRACAASAISRTSLRGEGLAATLLQLFQEGVQDETRLDELLRMIEFI